MNDSPYEIRATLERILTAVERGSAAEGWSS